MSGPPFRNDSQLWLEQALVAARTQHQQLVKLAQAANSRAQERGSSAEGAQLRQIAARLDAAVAQSALVIQALVPLPAPSPAQPAQAPGSYLAALEEERYRLARDIHDGPAQVLANAVLALQYCERLVDRKPEGLRAELAELQTSLREGLAEVRRLIFDLRPPALVEMGLEAALRRYLEEFRARTGLDASFEVNGDEERLTPVEEAAVLRIVQEALQNARKHARAKRVVVRMEARSPEWQVSVTDDGVGFDLAGVQTARLTLGLTVMRERAHSIGAKLSVDSAPGEGTTVRLAIPRLSSPGRA